MLKGKGILWADLDEDGQNGTAEELVQAYRHHIPFCIQVKGQRYTFRMVRGADDLADWAEHEKGEPDPANPRDREAPAIDELVPAMLSHVSHGINLRSQIEGSYKRITEADAAEDTFVKAVYGAYDKYVRELKKRGLYPI